MAYRNHIPGDRRGAPARRRARTRIAALTLCLALAGAAAGSAEEDFRAPGRHPSLLLTPARLRLLRRERERQSPRWRRFESLIAGEAAMPEQAFADVLYFQVSGDATAARRAIGWALGEGADLRQLALVFDWCQPAMASRESSALAAKLEEAIRRPPATAGVEEARSRAFAAIALAGEAPEASERELRRVVEQWWRAQTAPALGGPGDVLPRAGRYALFELLHAVRDNLAIDLRESAAPYFRELPALDLLSYYPPPYSGPQNDYRIPASRTGATDLRAAETARAADLAMAAYDTSSHGSEFLQGWLLHERFAMTGLFGAPYEFLWANPYQPGLSYYHAQLAAHDSVGGQLFIRSGWDDGARWAGCFDGALQTFSNGKPQALSLASPKLLDFGDAVVAAVGGASFVTLQNPVTRVFLVGLKPGRRYELAIGPHKQPQQADPGGIVELNFKSGLEGAIRIRELPAQR